MKKHILILGGYSPAHIRLAKLDYELTLFHYTKSIKTRYKDIYKRIHSFYNLDEFEWVEFGKTLDKTLKVDYVITFDDDLHNIALNICNEIGINYLYSEKTIELMNNKNSMRQYLIDQNFAEIESILIRNEEELYQALEKTLAPEIIIKPVNGSGSKNIFKFNKNDISKLALEAVCKELPKTTFVVEPFIEGIEYSVETYSEGGVHKIYCITKKYKDDHFVEIGHTIPADVNDSLYKEINEYINQLLNLLGVVSGPTHTEIIVSNKMINLVETQARVGGDMINELYEYATGIDVLTLIVKGMVGDKVIERIPSFENRYKYEYASILYQPSTGGVVQDIRINDTVFEETGILGYKVWCSVGDTLALNHSSVGRIAQVWAKGETLSDSVQAAQRALDAIVIEMK